MLIGDIRKEVGVSRLKFARFLGVSESSLVRWEKGITTPDGLPMVVINAIEKVLSQDVSEASSSLRSTRLKKIVGYAEVDASRSLFELFAIIHQKDLKKRFYDKAG